MSASLYPLFPNLQGRTGVVIGGKAMAETKVRELLNSETSILNCYGADFRMVGEEKLCWESRSYSFACWNVLVRPFE
jgi:hypothetical protein